MASANETQVAKAFRDVYGRAPTQQELNTYSNIELGDVRTVDLNKKLAGILQSTPDPLPRQGVKPGDIASLEGGSITTQIPTTTNPTSTPQQFSTSSAPAFSYPNFSQPSQSYSLPPFLQSAAIQMTGSPAPQNTNSGNGVNSPIYQAQNPIGSSENDSSLQKARDAAKQDPVTGEYVDMADKYVNDLLGEAQGDRDFAIRKLDSEHKIALGQNDTARAAFLEKVADNLETKIGRIPYDYEKYTSRELEDYSKGNTRIGEDKNMALARLNEDEQIMQKDLKTQTNQANQQQSESLNERGLLNGTRDTTTGIGGKDVQTLNSEVQTKLDAIKRQLGRSKEDTILGADRSIQDLNSNTNRKLQDIQTDARRGAIDTENGYQFNTEATNRNFESQRKSLERKRKSMIMSAPSNALSTRDALGAYGS